MGRGVSQHRQQKFLLSYFEAVTHLSSALDRAAIQLSEEQLNAEQLMCSILGNSNKHHRHFVTALEYPALCQLVQICPFSSPWLVEAILNYEMSQDSSAQPFECKDIVCARK